jgi:hypothetical protein
MRDQLDLPFFGTTWNDDRAGIPASPTCGPASAGRYELNIQMKQIIEPAKQAANAIWGSSTAHVRYKHIAVVDDDINIHDRGGRLGDRVPGQRRRGRHRHRAGDV